MVHQIGPYPIAVADKNTSSIRSGETTNSAHAAGCYALDAVGNPGGPIAVRRDSREEKAAGGGRRGKLSGARGETGEKRGRRGSEQREREGGRGGGEKEEKRKKRGRERRK